MTIIAFSGKKSSGKNTSFNFLLGLEMLKLAIVRDTIEIDDNGKLRISDIFGDKEFSGIFDVDRNTKAVKEFRNQYIYPFIQNYSFADVLKQNVCIELLGLSHEQCYGTDEQKNAPTEYKWEDMPGVITQENWDTSSGGMFLGEEVGIIKDLGINIHSKGPMSGRDVMQYIGTDIFRKMYPTIWADVTINRIKRDDSKLAVITDCRFPNEVEAVRRAGGKVIRLTRNIYEDNHYSETALDGYEDYDAIIDNVNMTISEQNDSVYKLLQSWDIVDTIN